MSLVLISKSNRKWPKKMAKTKIVRKNAPRRRSEAKG